jgi:hypothetical protein
MHFERSGLHIGAHRQVVLVASSVDWDQRREEAEMEYRIDRGGLAEFVAEQVALVEAVPLPRVVGEVLRVRAVYERAHPQEVRGLWLAAGLATHVGLAIFEQPERFVVGVASEALAV